jgi:hypothetical protein
MYKVIYTIKDKNGYLLDKTKKFDLIQDAFAFIREQKTFNMVGKPILERV